jgi:hypothetical protein
VPLSPKDAEMFTGRQEVMDPIQVTVLFHEFEYFVLPVAPSEGGRYKA